MRLSEPSFGAPLLTSRQKIDIQRIALTAACLSILSGLLVTYWFARMKTRQFRHHLIMLLIQSDMLKAVGYFVYPTASLAKGSDLPDHFCLTAGFFLEWSLVASDVAVLLIAVHAAMCILLSNNVTSSGLYDYRYYAYAIWFAFPTLLASLAFVNPNQAYQFQGTFCYLPVRPFWYRLALSWIPRYIILLIITGLYLAIYLYVRTKYKNFNLASAGSQKRGSDGPNDLLPSDLSDERRTSSQRAQSIPLTPMVRPGILDATLAAEASSLPIRSRNSAMEGGLHPIWESYTFGGCNPLPQPINPLPTAGPSSRPVSSIPSPTLLQPHRLSPSYSDQSVITLVSAFHDVHIESAAPIKTPWFGDGSRSLSLGDGPSQDAPSTMRDRQNEVKRQLRLVAIYPIVYMLMWIVPFANHCTQYFEYYARNPIYPLSCASSTILALQCAADCVLFSMREKPWRMSAGKGGPELFRQTRSSSKRRRNRGSQVEQGPKGWNHQALANGQDAERIPWSSRFSSHGRAQRSDVEVGREPAHGQVSDRGQETRSVAKEKGGEKMWWEAEARWRKDSLFPERDPEVGTSGEVGTRREDNGEESRLSEQLGSPTSIVTSE